VLAKLKADYARERVAFLSLTIESADTQAAVEEWLDGAGAANLTAGRASMDTMRKLIEMGGEEPGPVPATVFITPEGNVTRAIIGRADHDELVAAIEAIVPE
jgi:hypothetical protein